MNHLKLLLILSTIIVFKLSMVYASKNDGTMSIELRRKKSPRQELLENEPTLRKYGYRLEFLKNRRIKEPRTNDSIALYRYLDNEFYGTIVIGHPGKTFDVSFDTAWGLSWLLSSRCDTSLTPGCRGHNLYDRYKSSTFKKNGTQYFIQDGAFNFTGVYSYDDIHIAHSNVTSFLFVEMSIVPDSMQFDKADGVLGLGPKSGDYEPFFYTLYREKKIKNPIFSIYLNRDRNSNRGGNIMLGFFDPKHVHKTSYPNGSIIQDTIVYLNADTAEYWQFNVDKMIYTKDPKHVSTFCQSGCKAIADTSTNEINGPSKEVNQIHEIINAKLQNGRYIVNCDAINQMPKLDIYLRGQPFRLGGKQYIMKESNKTSTTCISAFVPDDTMGKNTWIFGGAFLSLYYSIYNIEDKTIGFVRAA
uniref:Lysosomal aspartic protease-like n=1 Tax=Diabrotica virgifera virgifera TaxID=50390 RepID=A0A6P7FU10_DIAVI